MPPAKPAVAAPAEDPKNHLEELAERCVGDKQEPNLFFVIIEERCVAVFIEEEDAVEFAELSDADVVEDRATGEVWASDTYEAAREDEEEEIEEEEEEEEVE